MADSPPAQKVTDKDLIKAIEQRCTQSGIPVVPTKEIERVDYIDIKKQAIARRLKKLSKQGKISSLKIGRGWVWWVPENKEFGGEADFSNIDWSSIDAEEIPLEKIQDHPELSSSAYWDQLKNDAEAMSRAGAWAFLIGLVIILVDEYNILISLTQLQADIGAFSLLGGMLLIFIGIVAISIAKTAISISEKGIDGWVRTKYDSLKSRVLAGVPIRISWEWKDNNSPQENK